MCVATVGQPQLLLRRASADISQPLLSLHNSKVRLTVTLSNHARKLAAVTTQQSYIIAETRPFHLVSVLVVYTKPLSLGKNKVGQIQPKYKNTGGHLCDRVWEKWAFRAKN